MQIAACNKNTMKKRKIFNLRKSLIKSIDKTVDEYQTLGSEIIADGLIDDIPQLTHYEELVAALSFCKSVIKSQGMFDLSEQMAYDKANVVLNKII